MPGMGAEQAAAAISRPTCVAHPDAVARPCGRCGTFRCDACLDRAGLCTGCADRQQPSALAIASALVGALSFCGFVWGVIAIVLAAIELGRIARGSAPARGADWAKAGLTLGAVALFLGLLLFVTIA